MIDGTVMHEVQVLSADASVSYFGSNSGVLHVESGICSVGK